MKQAVIYYNSGTKCLVRLAVSIASLRDHYKGDIVVYNQGTSHPLLTDLSKIYSFRLHSFPHSSEKALVTKVHILKLLQHEEVVFLDADTLVRQPLTQMFEWVRQYGAVFTNFEDWFTRGRTIQRRINGWRGIIGNEYIEQALNYGTAINTGVFGIKNDHPIIEPWCELARIGGQNDLFIPDEISAQILIPSFEHYLAPKEYNRSARYGKSDGCVVAHFHGRKHIGKWELCREWRNLFWELKDPLSLTDPLGDRALKDHMTKMHLPTAPYISKGGLKNEEPPTIPQPEGKWFDVVTTVVPRATVQRAMESFHKRFDKGDYKLRWVVHLDHVPAMSAGLQDTLDQIAEVAPLFDAVKFHQRDENVGHGLSLKWCFMHCQHDVILWEDDKVATREFSSQGLLDVIEQHSSVHVTFLHRGVRPSSTSPSWWSHTLIQHHLDNWPKAAETSDSEIALIHNSKQFPRSHKLSLGIKDIGIRAQADMGIVRKKEDRRSTYRYHSVDKRVTIVTAVDANYLPKLKKNAHVWVQRLNIMSYQLLVIRDKSVTDQQVEEIFPCDTLRVVEWDFPVAGDNQREKMLSSFIFLTAKEVKTPYWVKLDADVGLQQRRYARYCPILFEDWFNYDLVGHKWGYTKVKGDPGQTRHWVNVLDDWWLEKFPDATPLFDKEYNVGEKVKSPRIASFYCMQSTEFTQLVSDLCGDRLPVPSHDTVMYYVAAQLNKPMLRYPMKSLGFRPN